MWRMQPDVYDLTGGGGAAPYKAGVPSVKMTYMKRERVYTRTIVHNLASALALRAPMNKDEICKLPLKNYPYFST